MMRLIAQLALLACVLLAACKEQEPGTQVMVVIDAEPSVRPRVFDVDVVVKSGVGDVSTWSPRYEQRLTQGSDEVPWPLELALIPRDGDTSRNYLVVATARGESGGILAEVRAISGYVEGKSLSLPLVFDEKCLALDSLCEAPLTCRAGHCMDPFVEPSKLLPFVPGERPGDDLPVAGEATSGSGGQGGESGESGAGGAITAGNGGDGAVDECADDPASCVPDPIACDDERCEGCPENFLRLSDDSCAPLLIALGLTKGALAPALSTDDVRYEVAVPLLVDEVTLTPVVPDDVTIEVNGELLAADERSFTARDLPIGETTYVIVLRASGHDSRTYTLKLTRSGSQRSFIKAPNTGEDDMFGHAVAMQGDTIVVGAPGEDSSSKDVESDNDLRRNSGAAYVLVREGASYRHAAYLKADAIEQDAAFGTSVAIDGDLIAVGAPDERSGGSIYTFRRNASGEWIFDAKLAAALPADGRRLGASVAVHDGMVAGGAPADDAFGSDCGAAYVFTPGASGWTRLPAVGPDVPKPSIWFGSSVVLHGGALFVGATGDSNDVFPRGSVYVFERDGGAYAQHQLISDIDSGALDFFGDTIATDGERLVIGAFGSSGAATSSGAVYVYAKGSEGWAFEQRIGASNASSDAGFGIRVALLGDLIVTGAPDEDSGASGINGAAGVAGKVDSGAGYVFKRSGASWSELALIKAEPPETEDRYAFSVAADGDTLVFGAPNESSAATGVDGDALANDAPDSGAVYVVR